MDRIELPGITVDLRRDEARGHGGARIKLPPRAFSVMRCLAARAGDVVTKDDLLTECWPGVVVTEDSLTQCISEIRRTLGEGGRELIRTVSRRGYSLVVPDAAARDGSAPCPPGLWPSIAVLPFDEFSGGAGQGEIGAGFAEDIITELARNRNLSVLARHTAFTAKAQGMTPAEIAQRFNLGYVLEGSLRRMGERMVVNAQLIDGRDSRHVWAERYVFLADGLFTTLEELVTRISGALFSEVRETEKAGCLRRPPADLTVYELAIRGLAHKHQLTRDGLIAGRAELERAVALDARYAPTHIYLGYLNAADAGLALSGLLDAGALPAAISVIRRGIELDPTLAVGHLVLSFALLLSGQYEEALRAARRSVALGPGDAENLVYLGYMLAENGRCSEGLPHIEQAMALNPLGPGYYHNMAALAQFGQGNYHESLSQANATMDRSPGLPTGYAIGAAALATLDRKTEAAALIAELRQRSPRFSFRTPVIQNSYGGDPKVKARYLAALREAGLPDGD